MKTIDDLIADCLKTVDEIYPWDLEEALETKQSLMLIDIREPYEFEALHIKGSINIPRGLLEQACDYGYDETEPELVTARDKDIVVICRSGKRSVLAAHTLQIMGFNSVKSLKTGVKGWNDYELPLENINKETVDVETADKILMPHIRPEQMPPSTLSN